MEAVPVLDQERQLSGLVLIFYDITRQLASDSDLNLALQAVTRGFRASLAGIRSAIETIIAYPQMDIDQLEKFRKMTLLKDYVEQMQEEINTTNKEQGIDLSSTKLNGRRQTNLGIFRAYLVHYLRSNPKIHTGMTFLVRHLQPTPQGLPVEIYVFSSDKNWANYEAIQADIFDHVLAALPEFDLRVYQQPSGMDVASLKGM